MANDVTIGDGVLEPPSTTVIVVLVFVASFAMVLFCSSALLCLHRLRSTRRLVELLTSRLNLNTDSTTSDASRYPVARPSKYMKRFAGVSVVDANAIVDEGRYERLREFPEALVEVSEVGTGVDSADFSTSEVATTTASVYSRSGRRFTHPRSGGLPDGEGSCASDASRFGEHSYPGFPSLTMELERGAGQGGGGTIHQVPPSANVKGNSGCYDRCHNMSRKEKGEALESQPMSRLRTAAPHSRSGQGAEEGMMTNAQQTFQPSHVQDASPGIFGRRVITNISVEDLAAHCAALRESSEEENERNSADKGLRENGTLVDNLMDAADSSRIAAVASSFGNGAAAPQCRRHHRHTREELTTPLTPYEYIMRKKAKRAQRTARSVVVVKPASSSEASMSKNAGFTLAKSSEDLSSPASSQRSNESREFIAVERAGEGDEAVPTHRPKRTVRREHHRHHTNKGGFIVCQDFVPDLASRRSRRRQAGSKEQKFVFQLRDEEALYGRSQYLSHQSDLDGKEE